MRSNFQNELKFSASKRVESFVLGRKILYAFFDENFRLFGVLCSIPFPENGLVKAQNSPQTLCQSGFR